MKYSLYLGFTTIFEDDVRLFNDLLLENVTLQEIIDYLLKEENITVDDKTLDKLSSRHKATIEKERENNEFYLDTFTIVEEE